MADKTLLTLNTKDMVEVGEHLWMLPNQNNVLIRYNKKKRSIDYMTWIPAESIQENSYSKLVIYRQYLVLIPYAASETLIFDTENFSFEKLQIPKTDDRYSYREYAKFSYGVCKEDCVYLLPGEFPGIVCIDMMKKEAKLVREWDPLHIKEFGNKKPEELYSVGIETYAGLDKREMYMAFYRGEKGQFGRFSFDTYDMEIYTIDDVDSYFSCIECDDENIYLVTRAGEMICWNRKKNKVIYKYSLGLDFDKENAKYCSCGIIGESILYGEKIYLFLLDKPQYIEFDLNSRNMECHTFRQLKEAVRKVYISDGIVYLITAEKGEIFRYHKESIELCQMYKQKPLLYGAYVDGSWNRAFYLMEDEILSLEEGLDLLTNTENEREKKYDLSIGDQIYRAIKEMK